MVIDVCLFIERINQDNKSKMLVQREREEMQRNIDRFKSELELKHTRNVEKMKMESDEMMKRTLQDNMRRLQAETERILVASKKKSWCSNCTKEVFLYHSFILGLISIRAKDIKSFFISLKIKLKAISFLFYNYSNFLMMTEK